MLTTERTNGRHQQMPIALGDFVTWAKNTSDLIQIGIPTIRNADLKLNIYLCHYFFSSDHYKVPKITVLYKVQ